MSVESLPDQGELGCAAGAPEVDDRREGGVTHRLRRRLHLHRHGSAYHRRLRFGLLWRTLRPCRSDRVLDLGGGTGQYLLTHYPYPERIIVADVRLANLRANRSVNPAGCAVCVDPSCRLPFASQSMDIVFCNSVLEHVGPGERQQRFAREIRRVGRRYFVEVPNPRFIIEAHTLLPLVGYLPTRAADWVRAHVGRFWVKQATEQVFPLTESGLRRLFPDARVVREHMFGMTKAWVAVRS